MISAFLSACALLFASGASLHPDPADTAPVLLQGGRILIGDARGNLANALLMHEGRIVALGAIQDVNKHPLSAQARRIELAGSVVMPGLQDAHVDLEAMVESRTWSDFSNVTNREELMQRLAEETARAPEGSWILARGLDPLQWSGTRVPDQEFLASLAPFHPLYIEFRGGGLALANRAALTLAKLDGPLNPPPRVVGGRILLDKDGRSNGLFLGAARELIRGQIQPPPSAQWAREFPRVEQELIELGLTCVHDLGTRSEFLAFLREKRRAGELRLRIVSYPTLGIDPLATRIGERLEDLPQDLLSVPGVHVVIDSLLTHHGGALLDPYADRSAERGVLLIEEERLAGRLGDAARAGLQPSVEVHGDRAARTALDAFARLYASVEGSRALQPRLAGLDMIVPRDWPRVPELALTASLEPLRYWTEQACLDARLGPERSQEVRAWRGLATQYKRVAFGSGALETSWADPRKSFFAARASEAGALGLEGAHVLYTATQGAAQASRQEARRGSLQVGKAADLTILSGDPTRVALEDLGKLKVRAVWINGQQLYRQP